MRHLIGLAVLVEIFVCPGVCGSAPEGPKAHITDGFVVQGISSALDEKVTKHRLPLREIEELDLDGKPTDIGRVLGLLATYNGLPSRVEEPGEIHGQIRVWLPANAMGDEAYTACLAAMTYNGLSLARINGELVLIRPETRPNLETPKRPWNPKRILETQLFHLGYLNPDPIRIHYRDKIGTNEGHVISEPRSNVLIVVDSEATLETFRRYVDSEALEAMGGSARPGIAAVEGVRPPSLGAIVSREHIHFYLMAYARWNRIPLVASEQRGVYEKRYPEADLWTDERGYRALAQEYQRVSGYIQLARETGGEGWPDPRPERTLSPVEQRRLAIRFGLVSPLPGTAKAQATKKPSRRR